MISGKYFMLSDWSSPILGFPLHYEYDSSNVPFLHTFQVKFGFFGARTIDLSAVWVAIGYTKFENNFRNLENLWNFCEQPLGNNM